MRPSFCVALVGAVLFAISCTQSPVAPTQSASAVPGGAAVLAVKHVQDVPFSGVVTGEAVFDFVSNSKGCPSGFTSVADAKGTALHLGLTQWHSEHCFGATGEISDAELVLTAANGDQIYTTYTGSCTVPGAIGDFARCSGDAVFSKGTGRFANVSGTATWTAAVLWEGLEDFSSPGRWEWKGRITY